MMRNLRVAAVMIFAAGSCLGAGQAPSGQAPAAPQTPTFRVAVDYVEVDVLATDAQGNYVRDLKKEDFQIFEDGKQQTLSNFVPVDIPVERGEQALFTKQLIEPDVKSNEQPFGGRVAQARQAVEF